MTTTTRVKRVVAPMIVAIVFGICWCSLRVADAEASSAPAWNLSVTPVPTVLPLGVESRLHGDNPSYLLTATNVGGTTTNSVEPLTIVDILPPGLTPSAVRGPGDVDVGEPTHPRVKCEVAGQTITCRSFQALHPGESLPVLIPVDVSPSAPGAVTNEAEISGGGALPHEVSVITTVGDTLAPPGLSALATTFTNADGSTELQAGGHPYQVSFEIGFPIKLLNEGEESRFFAASEAKDIRVALPRGLVVNPTATATRCKEAELESDETGKGLSCPQSSQVGMATTDYRGGGLGDEIRPIYNMQVAPGAPAELGFDATSGVYVHLRGHVDSSGEYELSAESSDTLSGKVPLISVRVSLWGSPTDPSHDPVRGGPEGTGGCYLLAKSCPVERLSTAFLTLPSDCSGHPLETLAEASTWLEPSVFRTRSALSRDLDGSPTTVSGCGADPFEPSVTLRPTTLGADSPTGINFDLYQAQHLGDGELASANLKDAEVTLPAGLVIDPSGAQGLGSCTEAEIGLVSNSGGKLRFSESPQSCPNSAKIGTLTVSTPLLDHPLAGSIYVATPLQNPFGSLLAIYLAVEDEQSGIVAKFAGRVAQDPRTGQLTVTFTENPELPLEDIELHLFAGDTAALTSPLTCGNVTTTSTLTPWSAPEGADAHPSDSFQVGAGCSASEAAAPRTAAFTAGTVTPLAGAYSPFVLRLSRPDGSQHITGIETTLPEGLLGKLAGVAYCPESGIAQARSREAPEEGKLEQSAPSCPASSEVGTVDVTAGSGNNPIPVSGHVYLAGPYKGAPLSLAVIVPAVAGPFDLGTVVDRVALNVGEYDARIHAVADPLPTILDGIPLDLRSIEIKLGRPGFTLNPTSCEAKQVEGSFTTQAGQSQPLSNRFQVGDCEHLAFKPSLKLSLKGATGRTGHPSVKAVLTYPQQGEYANIRRAQVSLPHSEFLDQGNIGKACTKPVLAAHACPASSIYGRAKAWTPLLEKPLEGPVYLVGGFGYKLPALVAELDGQIRVLLAGKVDTGPHKGIRNTFEAVPDAPVSRFVLELKGGKKYGLLENSEDICAKKQVAGVALRAQNGRRKTLRVKITNSCGGKKKGRGAGRPPRA